MPLFFFLSFVNYYLFFCHLNERIVLGGGVSFSVSSSQLGTEAGRQPEVIVSACRHPLHFLFAETFVCTVAAKQAKYLTNKLLHTKNKNILANGPW